jgi:hypothetical protein
VRFGADPRYSGVGFGERCIVKRITIKDGVCWAEVHAVWNGRKDASPDVTAKLVTKSGLWVFANFYFPSPSNPDSPNLLGKLKALREMRKQSQSTGDGKY